MPKPGRRCLQPGCPVILHEQRRYRCDAHGGMPFASTKHLTRQQQGYGATWDRIRAHVLTEERWCRICRKEPATQVDHIRAKAHGGSDDRANLRGLCLHCHRTKTGHDSHGARR